MSDKRKLTTILAIAGATVLAAGGSAFVTDAGLSLLDPDTVQEQGTEVAAGEKETEQPLAVEKFTSTKDSFTVKPQKESEKKSNSDKTKESEKEGDSDNTSSTSGSSSDGSASQNGDSSQGGSSSQNSSASGSSASTDFSSSPYYSADGKFYNESEGGYYGENGLYHDQWGGYYSADGAYYDGSGGYWDGSGYHGSGSSSSGSSSSSNSGSSGGSSSGITIEGSDSSYDTSYAWDDSYMLYDVNSRYVSEDELSDWTDEDLARLRNEIFARHGRVFTTQKWIDYFATKTWYVPNYDFTEASLNDYEWANLEVILELENQRY